MSKILFILIALLTTAESKANAPFAHDQLVPLHIAGGQLNLAMKIYRPATSVPTPTLVLHHGATSEYGMHEALFKREIDFPEIAQFFVERGWAVVIPARRGRGGSEGQYDEGFSFIRALGYTCIPSISLRGAERALRDIAAAMKAIRAMPFVDPNRIVIGGVSRGGVLSVAYAGRYPNEVRGVINFVGGWLGEPCLNYEPVNEALFREGARYPGETLWLYAERDSYFPIEHSRANFAAFQAAGGRGSLHVFNVPDEDGHRLARRPEVWRETVNAYLSRLDAEMRRRPELNKKSDAALAE